MSLSKSASAGSQDPRQGPPAPPRPPPLAGPSGLALGTLVGTALPTLDGRQEAPGRAAGRGGAAHRRRLGTARPEGGEELGGSSRCGLSLPRRRLQGPPLEPEESESAPPQMGRFPRPPAAPSRPLWALTPLCHPAGGHLAPLVRIKAAAAAPASLAEPARPAMAQSPPRPALDPWLLPPGWAWAGHPPSTSPASSSDSSGSCPCDGARGPSRPTPPARGARTPRAAPTAPGRARPAPAGGQRQSASEREKLRMRTLARALLELRRFLPPSVAPAGRSLTKIETLRLAIRYIGHLSAVLGLGEDSLRRRRPRPRGSDEAAARGCPLCPDGGPAQAQTPTPTPARGPMPGSAAPAAPGPWGSPPGGPGGPAAPECLGSRPPDVGPWVPPPYCPGTQSLPPVSQPRAPAAAPRTQPAASWGARTPGERRGAATPWAPPPAAAQPAGVFQVPCPGGRQLDMDGVAGSGLQEIPCFWDPG